MGAQKSTELKCKDTTCLRYELFMSFKTQRRGVISPIFIKTRLFSFRFISQGSLPMRRATLVTWTILLDDGILRAKDA